MKFAPRRLALTATTEAAPTTESSPMQRDINPKMRMSRPKRRGSLGAAPGAAADGGGSGSGDPGHRNVTTSVSFRGPQATNDNTPRMPVRQTSPSRTRPTNRDSSDDRRPRRRGSLSFSEGQNSHQSSSSSEHEKQARMARKIVEDATRVVSSMPTGPSQEDMDKYGYGCAAPDGCDYYDYDPADNNITFEALAPPTCKLVVGAGKAPRRSSLKLSSKSDHDVYTGRQRRRSSLSAGDTSSGGDSFSGDSVESSNSSHGSAGGGGRTRTKRRASIKFADYDAVLEVEPVKNLASQKADLWYDSKEMREINDHNRYMVDVAKSGEIKDRKLCIRGLESFLVPSKERRAQQKKIWDSVMMIQDHQWQHGIVDDEIMSKVCRKFTRDDSEIAATRANEDARDTIKYLAKSSKKSSSRRDRPSRRQSLG